VIPSELGRVLEATGYLDAGQPAPGVRIEDDARTSRRGRTFAPDAVWRASSALAVYFKYEQMSPPSKIVAAWHQEIWNEGFAPLLWIVSPTKIDLYNGFGRPIAEGDADTHRLRTFRTIEQELRELDEFAGRVAMETGQFWLRSHSINRRTTVDQQLLFDLAALERDLLIENLDRQTAQGLIGRSIFMQYLVDRKIVDETRLKRRCGQRTLPAALRSSSAADALFNWLRDAFNGDMFPASTTRLIRQKHLSRVADFLEAMNPQTGQRSLFPYQFDIIPVELISSIYEQFAHSSDLRQDVQSDQGASAKHQGVHYTRLPLVSLILDEVMNGLSGDEIVLDLTCGSGVFLVEAFRRLVIKKGGSTPSRDIIRSILYHQLYGVDVSEAAIHVAAFSLYLAALELDPNPRPPEALKFKPIIGKTLIVGDARTIHSTPAGSPLRTSAGELRRFDVIVGNPPWTFRGRRGTASRRERLTPRTPMQPRGEGLDFVLRAIDFSHEHTRYGIVLSAMPFFAGSKTGAAAAQDIIRRLSPSTLVNLAPLIRWLFPTAKMPAVALLARCREQPSDQLTVVNIPWSPSSERSHTFEISPADIATIRLTDWERDPERLKTIAFGRPRDMLLIDRLRSKLPTLDTWLSSIEAEWRDGLIMGKPRQRTRSASHLNGLEIIESDNLKPFDVPSELKLFHEPKAQWPRSRETYRAPLLLIKEFLKSGPRPITALVDRDLVYTDAYFGASLGKECQQIGHLIAAILGSSLSSWFFLMTASEFGIWKRRLFKNDVGLLPIPDPVSAIESRLGRDVIAIERVFRTEGPSSKRWAELDNAVLNLYGLDDEDQLVVADGLRRARWQWKEGREDAAAPAEIESDLLPYGRAFLTGIEAWLGASNRRHMRAEVYKLPQHAPLRILRFILENGRGPSSIEAIDPGGNLAALILQIGQRLNIRISSSLVGARELRVHGQDEVVIIKPSARRFWMPATALEDVDIIVGESFAGL
jgi:hypothetical protein